jgi:hypothetical protein
MRDTVGSRCKLEERVLEVKVVVLCKVYNLVVAPTAAAGQSQPRNIALAHPYGTVWDLDNLPTTPHERKAVVGNRTVIKKNDIPTRSFGRPYERRQSEHLTEIRWTLLHVLAAV